jgi:hypothetical protein
MAAWQAQQLSEQWQREDLLDQEGHRGQECHQSRDRPQEMNMGFLKDIRMELWQMELWQTDLPGAALKRPQARTVHNIASSKISSVVPLLRSLCHL